MILTVETRGERNDSQIGGDVKITVLGQWIRLAAYYGTPPGSHIGVWRTHITDDRGDFQGINVRVGRRYLGPCLTLLAHTHPDWNRK